MYTIAPDRQTKRAVIPSREDGEEPHIVREGFILTSVIKQPVRDPSLRSG